MSSTNKTTNYNLSQFIGTDKPAWLTDYNSDMSKIDAGVNTAQSTATGADGKATANATAIGTLSSLTTDAKTNLVAAINEVDANADTAINTASGAAGNASQALTKVNDLAAYLTLSNIVPIAATDVIANAGTINASRTILTLATNNDKSCGKFYGRIVHHATSEATYTITLNIDSGIHPSADFTIWPAGQSEKYGDAANFGNNVGVTYKTDGKITVQYYATAAGDYQITFWPCLYFFTDFGDKD